MTGQVIPETLDQRADQLVDLVDAVERRQLAAPQVLDDLHGRCRQPGVAMLPRNRVRTSWKGTGQPCISSNARTAFSPGPLAAFFISVPNVQRSDDERLAAIGRQGAIDSLAVAGAARPGSGSNTMEHNDHVGEPGNLRRSLPGIVHSELRRCRLHGRDDQNLSSPRPEAGAADGGSGIAPSALTPDLADQLARNGGATSGQQIHFHNLARRFAEHPIEIGVAEAAPLTEAQTARVALLADYDPAHRRDRLGSARCDCSRSG